MNAAAAQLPQHQQNELSNHFEEMQIKESLVMYNKVVSKCFDQCVYKFSSKMLDSTETPCLEHCAEKFLKTTARVGNRFQEIQAQAQQKQMQNQNN